MEGRRRRGRPKYTLLDISKVLDINQVDDGNVLDISKVDDGTLLDIRSRVEDGNLDNGSSKVETAALESEEVKKEKDIKANEDGLGQEATASDGDMVDQCDKESRTDTDNIEATYSEDFADDFDFEENLWEADDEERGRKRDKDAEYHLFVKTHQKRRHRGTRHRARSSS